MALLLLFGFGAKADVIDTFAITGNLNTFLGSLVPFTGSMNVDFSNNFSLYQVQSLAITVQGRSVFDTGASVVLSASSTGTIQVSNSDNDTLTLIFTTPVAGAWTNFDSGQIFFGDVVFGGLTGSFFGADGVVTRDASDSPIIPRVGSPSAAVPELSTWMMMLVGLAGFALAAARRRALAFLDARA